MPRFRYKVGQVVQHIPDTVFEREEIGIVREILYESAYWSDTDKGSYFYSTEWIHMKDIFGEPLYTTVQVKTCNSCIRPADDVAVLLYG